MVYLHPFLIVSFVYSFVCCFIVGPKRHTNAGTLLSISEKVTLEISLFHKNPKSLDGFGLLFENKRNFLEIRGGLM
jgi:hypothetical protein